MQGPEKGFQVINKLSHLYELQFLCPMNWSSLNEAFLKELEKEDIFYCISLIAKVTTQRLYFVQELAYILDLFKQNFLIFLK